MYHVLPSHPFIKIQAGCFEMIKNIFNTKSSLSCDLQQNTLHALSLIMLAQAQELFWLKSLFDKMKDGIVAKLASAAAEMFSSALNMAVMASVFPEDWIMALKLRMNFFFAEANYKKSKEALTVGKYGLELAYLYKAQLYCKIGLTIPNHQVASTDHIQELNNLQSVLEQNITRADKDNNLICRYF
jgi:programmed cell death 6-interacting protein